MKPTESGQEWPNCNKRLAEFRRHRPLHHDHRNHNHNHINKDMPPHPQLHSCQEQQTWNEQGISATKRWPNMHRNNNNNNCHNQPDARPQPPLVHYEYNWAEVANKGKGEAKTFAQAAAAAAASPSQQHGPAAPPARAKTYSREERDLIIATNSQADII